MGENETERMFTTKAYCTDDRINEEERDDAGAGEVLPSVCVNYFREIGQFPVLDREKESVIARRCREGDQDSRTQFTDCNLKLVVHEARKLRSDKLPLEDLIQAGNLGLLYAGQYLKSLPFTRIIKEESVS